MSHETGFTKEDNFAAWSVKTSSGTTAMAGAGGREYSSRVSSRLVATPPFLLQKRVDVLSWLLWRTLFYRTSMST